jgi:lysozyme
MNISQAGIKLIEKLEGCILQEYKDEAGVPTIGVGHTGGVYAGQKITQAQADTLLMSDLKKFVDRVNKFVKVPVNQNQFDALVIFDFNTGSLDTSTLLKKLNAKDYKGAAEQFIVWNKVTDPDTGKKVVSNGLINRRKAEQTLFNTPVKTIAVTSKPKEFIITHKVRKGENLTLIAHAYKTTIERILKVNPTIKNANIIYPNQIIKVPDNR